MKLLINLTIGLLIFSHVNIVGVLHEEQKTAIRDMIDFAMIMCRGGTCGWHCDPRPFPVESCFSTLAKKATNTADPEITLHQDAQKYCLAHFICASLPFIHTDGDTKISNDIITAISLSGNIDFNEHYNIWENNGHYEPLAGYLEKLDAETKMRTLRLIDDLSFGEHILIMAYSFKAYQLVQFLLDTIQTNNLRKFVLDTNNTMKEQNFLFPTNDSQKNLENLRTILRMLDTKKLPKFIINSASK